MQDPWKDGQSLNPYTVLIGNPTYVTGTVDTKKIDMGVKSRDFGL